MSFLISFGVAYVAVLAAVYTLAGVEKACQVWERRKYRKQARWGARG